MKPFRRCLAAFVAASLVFSSLAQAAPTVLIGTEQAAAGMGSDSKAQLQALLTREDLAAELQSRGVSMADLRARVDALTDAEAAQALAQIDRAPAGGDVLGLLFTVFIILLVTDILGLTKVFPFTRPVR